MEASSRLNHVEGLPAIHRPADVPDAHRGFAGGSKCDTLQSEVALQLHAQQQPNLHTLQIPAINMLPQDKSQKARASKLSMMVNKPGFVLHHSLLNKKGKSGIGESRADRGNENSKSTKLPEVHVVKGPSRSLSQKADSSSSLYRRRNTAGHGLEVGLENLGNTCFINSMLQCLLHVEPLVGYFLQKSIEKEISEASQTKGVLAVSFAGLVKEMRIASSAGGSSISPSHFLRALRKLAPHLLNSRQQDCQEFLRYFLNGMSEDLCRTRKETPIATERSRDSVESSGTRSTEDQQPRQSMANRLRCMTRGVFKNQETTPSSDDEPDQADAATDKESDDSVSGNAEKVSKKTSIITVEPTGSCKSSSMASQSYNSNLLKMAALEVFTDDSCEGCPTKISQFEESSDALSLSSLSNSLPANPQKQAPFSPPLVVKVSKAPSSREEVVLSSQIRGIDKKIENFGHLSEPVAKGTESEGKPNSEWPMVTHVEAQHDSNVSMQAKAKPTPSVSRDSDAEAARKADAEAGEAWRRYLQGNDSVVTDIFAGQLQNAIECLTCGKRWSIFEPFMDLSVPIPKARGRPCSRDEKGRPHAKCSLHDCLKKFVGEELLTGENMVMCDYCKTKRQCRKNMTIYKYPRVLVIHMKRFRYSQATREKVLTDVGFPLADLDMSPYTSADKVAATSATSRALSCMKIDLDQKPIYDLVGVSHHIGGMQGGHYAAHVNTGAGESRGGGASGLVSGRSRRSCHSTHSGGPSGGLGSGRESETTISDQTSLASGESGHTEARQRWICFNDARVTQVSPANLLGPSAYVLFYRLKESGESYC